MTTQTEQRDGAGPATASETLTIIDNRTGKQYEIPIEDETIRATELRNIKVNDDDFGRLAATHLAHLRNGSGIRRA